MGQLRENMLPTWPSTFNHPRVFNKDQENHPFVKVISRMNNLDDDSDDDDDDSEIYTDCSGEDFDDEEGYEKVVVGEHEKEKTPHTGVVDIYCAAGDLERGPLVANPMEQLRLLQHLRRFLRPVQGIEQKRLHLDDEAVIFGFCQRASHSALTMMSKPGQTQPLIAIVDSRDSAWYGSARLQQGALPSLQRRGLTATQLYDELCVPVSFQLAAGDYAAYLPT